MALPVRAPVVIAGVGVLTAAGCGLDALWEAMLAARPLARPVARYDTEGLSTRVAALVDDATTQRLSERWPGVDLPARMALDCVAQAAVRAALRPTAALFVGTSLGSVCSWEPWHRALVSGCREAPPRVGHPRRHRAGDRPDVGPSRARGDREHRVHLLDDGAPPGRRCRPPRRV